jgi:dsDNA-binding SOS-regulon protein
MNQNEMPTFDVSSIPQEFSPFLTLDTANEDSLYKDDGKLFIQFRTEAVLHPADSTRAGRPIYNDVDMIIIRTPGSQLTSIVAPVKYYMHRFGDKYRLWKAGQEEAASGTPLENFPFLFTKPSLIAELKYRNIFTVEQLATLTDSAKQSVMGGHELCKKAADWITKTASDVEDAEKEELKAKLARMEQQMALLMAQQPVPGGKKGNVAKQTEVPEFMASK